ncbi:glycosyltransferase family 2 protein [Pseudovibrio sp. SPO723]|uniref:glycosyltransferase family 2 protein n=1 Tax=Nesiotobacter zosterae TaxID=392721 RepID=UPI0029C256C2|nr:glycosyltransferase family 2 protein [Pseudovibrio sp. SPO723]MDX5593403.1 glycosyltransferase family 2 protein [Pseudovibrio sp. SPO723]
MQKQEFRVDVVIVSYNSSGIIRKAIENLPKWAQVIVVDNNSSDDIANALFETNARLISLERNYGFGTACNRGAEIGSAPFILFLNPDAQIDPEALAHLMCQLEEHSEWGMIAPKICYSDGSEFFRGMSFFEPELGAPKIDDGVGEVYVQSGSVLLCKRSVFEEVGGFDENIFLFMEDDDLSYRVRLLGYKLVADRRVSAVHLHGQSSGSSLKLEKFKALEAERSKIYAAKKHDIAYSVPKQITQARKRLLRAVLLLDFKRVARNWGRLEALVEARG